MKRVFMIFATLIALLVSHGCVKKDERTAEEIGIVSVKDFSMSDKSLKIEVWATSPMLYNPSGMDIDQFGNVWVTENVNYRTYHKGNKKHKKFEDGDRIVVLIDSDHDGKADESKVFVQDKDLIAPTGLAVLDNKIYVSSSPNLFIYTDINRNLVFDEGDKKEVFLTGFGGMDHDHSLHKIEAGPDGRLYINAGNAGPHIVTDKAGFTLRVGSDYKGGSPYNVGGDPTMISDDGQIWNAGFIMSMKEDGTDTKVLGHNFRNPWGHSIDSFGDIWMNDNDDTQSCRTTWIMRYGSLGYTGFDGAENWRVGQRLSQSVPTAHWRQEDPGVIPSGHIYAGGSPTGVVYWEVGDGMLLSCEARQNVIWGYKRKKDGAGFKMEAIPFLYTSDVSKYDTSANTLAGNETKKWFRPSDIAVGPDGSLYVADWFDSKVGGHRQFDKKASGTIYRISPKRSKFKPIKYDSSTLEGAIDALKSPAVHVRYIARKKILGFGEKAIEGLKNLYTTGNKFEKGRVLFLLAELGEKAFVEKALTEDDSDVAVAAYRALEQNSKDILPLARTAIESKDIALRREIALSLKDIPFAQSGDLILELISSYDGKDRWYLEAIGTACEGKESQIYSTLKKDPKQWDTKTTELMWRLHPKESVNDFKFRALDTALDEKSRKQSIDALAFIHTKKASEAMIQIATSVVERGFLHQYTLWWLHNRKGNYWKNHLASVDVDAMDPFLGEEKHLIQAFEDDPTSYNVDKLLKIENGAKYLLDKLRNKQLSWPLSNRVKKKLLAHKDPSTRALAQIYLNKNKQKGKLDIQAALAIKGDIENGKSLFHEKAACITCHVMNGKGGAIGPELTQVKTKFDRASLIDSIVHPSSDILIGYESVTITLKDGTTLSGMLELDNDPVVIRSAVGQKQKIAVKDIAKKEISSTSIMPSASVIGLNEQELADLVAYLYKVSGTDG